MENEDKGLFNNIIDSLVGGLEKLIKIIKKHGILYTILIMVIFIGFWTLIVNPIRINNIVEDRLKQHHNEVNAEQSEKVEESIVRRENANYFVAELMINIIKKFDNVDRVLLLEKHNGSSNINGVDFLYSSATYELVNDTIENPQYLFDDLQKQTNLNLLGVNLIQTLKHTDYLVFDDLQKQKNNQCRLLRKLYNSGDKQAIIFSFKDSKHRPIIMLIISGDYLNVQNITEYIMQFKKQIEELLID